MSENKSQNDALHSASSSSLFVSAGSIIMDNLGYTTSNMEGSVFTKVSESDSDQSSLRGSVCDCTIHSILVNKSCNDSLSASSQSPSWPIGVNSTTMGNDCRVLKLLLALYVPQLPNILILSPGC